MSTGQSINSGSSFSDNAWNLLRNQVKYVLQNFPNGAKFKDVDAAFQKYYGHSLDPMQYNCSNFFSLFNLLPDIVDLNKCKSVALLPGLKGDRRHKVVMDKDKFVQPRLYKTLKVDDYYESTVASIYDPNKFWIVIKPRELELFQIHMNRIYGLFENQINIPRDVLAKGLACVVRVDENYCRAIVSSCCTINRDKIRVFCVDSGNILDVGLQDVYYLQAHHASVARFAFRACLAGIQPNNSPIWTRHDVDHFSNLVTKRTMICKIVEVEEERVILHVAIRELCGHFCDYVNDLLVSGGLAKRLEKDDGTPAIVFGRYVSKVKYLFMYPTFEEIETSKLPPSVKDLENLCHMPLDKLYVNYLKHTDND